jgi:hypothetical protein
MRTPPEGLRCIHLPGLLISSSDNDVWGMVLHAPSIITPRLFVQRGTTARLATHIEPHHRPQRSRLRRLQ